MNTTIKQVFARIEKGFNIHAEDITLKENDMIEVLITDRDDVVNCWLNIKPYDNNIGLNNIQDAITSECDIQVCNYSSTYYFTATEREGVKVSDIENIIQAVKNSAEYQYVASL